MKKLAKSIVSVILGVSMGVSAFAFTACGHEDAHTTHIWGTYTSDGKDGHHQTCTGCDEISETVAHEYSSENDIDCNKCGFVRELGGTVDPGKDPGTDPDVEDPTKATINVTADKTVINVGTNETVKATATIEGLTDKSVVWSLEGDGMSYVNISQDGVLSLKGTLTPRIDQAVKIVATSTVSSIVTNSVTIVIKVPVVAGKVGDLTSEMFEALGNSQITVAGEVADVYDDLVNDKNDSTHNYEYKVMMSDGAWYGEWNRKGSDDVEASNYRRSENTVSGSDNHTFDQLYIDKNNNVAQKAVTDYNSIAAIWEEQHMWNHLAQLGKDVEAQWEYDALNKVYVYQFDNKSEADIYLRTYLAVSLTPMLKGEDTLEQITLTVENGAITGMKARTYVTYEGGEKEGSSEGATSMFYTTLTAVFTDVGNTTVPTPKPYEADFYASILASALENMGSATNYTFRAVENTIYAPDYSDYDYSLESVSTAGTAKKARTSASNSTSASGTVGLVGQVTSDAILLALTGKYSSTIDGNLYWTDYSGYKKIDDNTYDYFKYDGGEKTLVGQRQYKGNLFDNMPKFDFSANVFEFAGMSQEKVNGEWVNMYNFTLRESAITRDIAMQISSHSNAKDAKGSTYGTLKITVLGDGENARIISTEYPYDLVSGTYLGTIKTTYTNIGTTTLPEDTFEGYVPRVIKDSWSQYNVKYYHSTHSTLTPDEVIDAGTLFENIFGTDAQLPSPLAFYNAFTDTMSGPFFDWKTEDNTANGGEIIYHDYLSINLAVDECDENGKISKEQHDSYISKLTEELKAYGYKIQGHNTYVTEWGDRYTTYINETSGIIIRVHNNRTRFFFIDIMPVGLLNK